MFGAIVLSVACGVVWLAWSAYGDPDIAFLTPRAGGHWIMYPKFREVAVRPRSNWDTTFRRDFEIPASPSAATLRVRALRDVRLLVNGEIVAAPTSSSGSWRTVQQYDVTRHLRTGQNHVIAVVMNDRGPPALWARLDVGNVSIGTDETWVTSLLGAADRTAHLATRPLEASANEEGRQQIPALAAWGDVWPVQLVIIALAAALVLGGRAALQRVPALRGAESDTLNRWGRLLVVGLIVVPWVALLVHNAPMLEQMGFDNDGHVGYFQHILVHKSLPLADDGWEMFQPPLYHMLIAGGLAATGIDAEDAAAAWVYRMVGLVIALAQIGVIFLALRLLFPGRTRLHWVGVVLAAGMPMHMYLAHYPTNELLAALLASVSLYLALRILRDESDSRDLHVALGAALGAAMLTKFSALLVTVVVLMVLAGVMAWRKERRPAVWLRTIGAVVVTWLLVCGWHYARVWSQFGTPLVGNWDPVSGFLWWQDPGYHVLSDYFRFGAVFIHPLFSAQHGMLDGFYSTAWGDGLAGGVGDVRILPPWNFTLMSAGYVLAVVPTLLLVVGSIAALVQLVRRPNAAWLMLLALVGLTGLAVLLMSLRIPSHGHAKAFYALPLMLAWCALSIQGFDRLRQWWRPLGSILLVLLVAWSINAYLTFWARADNPLAILSAARMKLHAGRPADAIEIMSRAAETDPNNDNAQRLLVELLLFTGRQSEATAMLDQAIQRHPDSVHLQTLAAELTLLTGDPAAAVRHATIAASLSPDSDGPHALMGEALGRMGRMNEAAAALREALSVKPDDPQLHRQLADAYRALRRTSAAKRHAQYAQRFGNDSTQVDQSGR